jgi:hypothetical protein
MMSERAFSTTALLLLFLLGGWSSAHAAGTCTGTMQASLLHPLPKPLTVGSARGLADTPNPELSRRFVEGLQKAGVDVTAQGNTTLSIAVSVLAPVSSEAGVATGTYKGLDWTSGLTVTPGQVTSSLRLAKLSLSAVVSDNAEATQSWVETINCTVQTDDPGTLAEFIGSVIGQTIGRNIDQKGV